MSLTVVACIFPPVLSVVTHEHIFGYISNQLLLIIVGVCRCFSFRWFIFEPRINKCGTWVTFPRNVSNGCGVHLSPCLFCGGSVGGHRFKNIRIYFETIVFNMFGIRFLFHPLVLKPRINKCGAWVAFPRYAYNSCGVYLSPMFVWQCFCWRSHIKGYSDMLRTNVFILLFLFLFFPSVYFENNNKHILK